MGTSAFSLPILKILLNSEHEVIAIFTAKPKPQGRGLKLSPSPIGAFAADKNIPIYTPDSLRKPEVFDLIDNIEADIIVVVAYGFIIPKNILWAKKYGTLNVHPSLLPKYRGAAPLQRAIINGDDKTAVCIMQMDEGLDTGDVILSEELTITPRMTLIELHDICANIGAKLMLEVLNNIEKLPRYKQDNKGIVYAHKLTKEEGLINWSKEAKIIDCQVRGMSPWPSAYFNYRNIVVKVLEVYQSDIIHSNEPGKIIAEPLVVACGSNTALNIVKVQAAGSKALSAAEFVRGIRLKIGDGLD